MGGVLVCLDHSYTPALYVLYAYWVQWAPITCNGLFKSVATFGYKCRLQSYRLGAETSPVGPSAQSYLSKVWTISAKPC